MNLREKYINRNHSTGKIEYHRNITNPSQACRYYHSPQGCRYGKRCKFFHQPLQMHQSVQYSSWNQFNASAKNGGMASNNKQLSHKQDKLVDTQSLDTLLPFFISQSKMIATVETISSIIEKNKSNKHFIKVIIGEDCTPSFAIASYQHKRFQEFNILKRALEIITELDRKYTQQQKIWFEIAMYLSKTLNQYLTRNALQEIVYDYLLANLNENLYDSNSISYLLSILKQIMILNPKLQISLVFITTLDHGSYYSNKLVLKHFPSPKVLVGLFNACNFGQILPFDTSLIDTIVTIQEKIDYMSKNPWTYKYKNPWTSLKYYKQNPQEIPASVTRHLQANIDKKLYLFEQRGCKLFDKSKKPSSAFGAQFCENIRTTMPLHWIIISIRVFRDIYWNNIQSIIQNAINDEYNIDNGNIMQNNNSNMWNLDVMQIIVSYCGDNNPLIGTKKYKLFECDELNDIYAVVRCLKILNKNMNMKKRNVFYKANDKLVTEWLNYFVKHRNYKYLPKNQNELMKCNFFANRAVSK